jgi:hypothetical protein
MRRNPTWREEQMQNSSKLIQFIFPCSPTLKYGSQNILNMPKKFLGSGPSQSPDLSRAQAIMLALPVLPSKVDT